MKPSELRPQGRTHPPPIFIVGCPRSGTTLLAELLAGSPWGTPVETHFIPKYFKRLHQYGPLEERSGFKRLVSEILRERPVMQWRLEVDPERLYETISGYDYATIADTLCRLRAERLGTSSWGDKTPNYVLDLDVISRLFPTSKVIHVIRDGRDVTLSLLKKPWGPGNVYACAEYWKRCNELTPTIEALLTEERMLQISYESLLAQPHLTVERIFRFLGEPVPAEAAQGVGRIKDDNCGKWRVQMKPDDIRLFEEIAGERLRAFGYVTTHETRRISRSVRIAYYAHDFLHWSRHMIRQNLLDAFRIRYLKKEPFGE
jgi:Sulfotransferase family